MEFDFIRPSDNPALVAVSTQNWREAISNGLERLSYKVQTADDPESFLEHFRKGPFQIVCLEETFAAASKAENEALINLQRMPMASRRHAMVFLIGESFETLHPFQAFRESVHAVIHPDQLSEFSSLVEKVRLGEEKDLTLFTRIQEDLAKGNL